MADMRTELDRKLHHQQPRMRCDFTTPGFVHPDQPVECTTCGGAGVIVTNPQVLAYNPAALRDTECPTCAGTGVAR